MFVWYRKPSGVSKKCNFYRNKNIIESNPLIGYHFDVKFHSEISIDSKVEIKNPIKWSAEIPYLYTLLFLLRNQENEITEIESCKFGFRKFEFVQARPGATWWKEAIGVMPALRKHLNNSVLPKQVWARDLDIRISDLCASSTIKILRFWAWCLVLTA